MKRTTGTFLSMLMTAVYLLACMGFGIHTCHDDGSRHFVWMLGDVSCKAIHHHSHDADHNHHHDDGCCSTQVYVLTDAQDNATDDARIAAPEISLPLLSVGVSFLPTATEHTLFAGVPTPPLISPPTPSRLSVWLV